jgi:GNAT superfamily N-acetyltransferase
VTIAIRRVDGTEYLDTLHALHTLTFPDDQHVDYRAGYWWIAFAGDEPAAFAGMLEARTERNAIYLARCGVLAGFRGQGLQRRLLRSRITLARRLGRVAVITTTYENPPSGNNLIAAGFRLYEPAAPWGGSGTCYWRLPLQ